MISLLGCYRCVVCMFEVVCVSAVWKRNYVPRYVFFSKKKIVRETILYKCSENVV